MEREKKIPCYWSFPLLHRSLAGEDEACFALIAGGSGTSNIILTWTIYSILRNPFVMEKVKAELDIHVGKEKMVSENDISKLKYLQATVKETLRLYPPLPLLAPREFTENCTLSGYNIEKGTRLITNIWKIQTDSNVWEDPLDFKPERFLTTHKDIDIRGHNFELLPFGSGRRKCPGITFGLQMVHFNLATLLHSFEILSSSPDLIDITETSELIDTSVIPLEILIKPCLSFSCYENNLSLC
ncbi:cytochrome P450 82A1-like [Vigna angularis]|uniref:cytochrome P450 82A1-like n=1 Tax=Phaseolus angularis TaxID=3914 RepID=UPI0022B504F9|nr:cytochrome P450 82A1-like [Vigna angularis]